MRLLAAFSILAIVAMSPATAAQPSRSLSAVHPRWSADIDSRYAAIDRWIARDERSVYALRNGALEAIDARTGRIRWSTALRSDGPPALAGTTIYLPVARGLAAVDALSGRRLPSIAVTGQTNLVGATSGAVAFSTAPGIGVVARGLGPNGTVRWTRRTGIAALSHDSVVLAPVAWNLGADAVGVRDGGNGILILDARDGRAVAATNGVDEKIGADGRYLWFSVVNGGIKGLDIATNRSIALHGSIVNGAARVEHGIAVAVVDGRLHRIDLRRGEDRVLHIDGRWIGGPAAGKIFIERGDGLYTMSIDGGKQTRAVAYQGETRNLTTDGRTAYATTEGGRLYVIDVVHARAVAQLDTGCDATEGISSADSMTIVHCDRGPTTALIAFDRYSF